MKLTSQTLLVTCLTPTSCPAKTEFRLILRRSKQMRPQLVTSAARSWNVLKSYDAVLKIDGEVGDK